ncbi:hypothetical protein N181_01815 [Sinorhizobium fredii USDA 205]|uniref:Uncharacterized protein n=1 Tax=Rhizobium fredii TaxID=380 RepID=A0A844AH99_RHIFR|nr:hypothetical protein [Sinorhizobium fredii]KSV87362.1 hypothetical protein N181_01815 [Sinorhizobium fredii USDA 205]MQX11791.1 hypothetical protein [Sinorhizobium fredii]
MFGIVVLSLFIVSAVGAYAMLWWKADKVAKLDSDHCPVEGPSSVTAVLLDVTDPIKEITKIDLKRQFQKAVAGVETGGLIEVYALSGEEGKLARTFRGCNPGDGETADPWTTNPKKIQERWKKAFEEPLKQIAEHIGEAGEANSSPIMAGVQRIVIESFSDPKANGKNKTLYVASDMIEHTDSFSIYKSGADYEAFENSVARARFRTPLDGIGVKLLVFQRETAKPLSDLPEFWTRWVDGNGGEFIGYERMAGVE